MLSGKSVRTAAHFVARCRFRPVISAPNVNSAGTAEVGFCKECRGCKEYDAGEFDHGELLMEVRIPMEGC